MLRRIALAALLACLAWPLAAAEPLTSVPELDISRYAGHWYEIARLPNDFQEHCARDVTATYTLREDGLIGVRNDCLTGDGEAETAGGVARVDSRHPGRLQVRFAGNWLAWLPWVWGDYWVIALDPGYTWAMVGEPDRDYLWILSREPGMDRALFERLTAQAEAMGYDLDPLQLSAPLR